MLAPVSPPVSPDDLRKLRADHGAEYEIAAIRGALFAWRHDGTTATITCDTPEGMRAAIVEDRRARARIPHQRAAA